MNKIIHAALLLSMATCLTGCGSMTSLTDCKSKIRNKCIAQKAWNHWSWCYDDLDHPHHFARGFKAGYRDILEGGKGCQPTLPPKCYWSSCHSPQGVCEVNAWFDGFLHGVLAANQDGVGSFSQVPISPTARMNLEASRNPHPYGHSGEHGPPPIAIPEYESNWDESTSQPLIDGEDEVGDPGKVDIDEVIDPARDYE